MPKQKTAKKPTKSFEESLWETATKLRGSVESAEYKHVMLSLVFLKFASIKFEERRAELIAVGKEQGKASRTLAKLRDILLQKLISSEVPIAIQKPEVMAK
ncbi:MAG: type I restriction-modification system subunit M N-terminal domain-containing protein [Verrucomicrobiales bacterium]|nr:type I restriction-modification system subunit M N-terminal domain-containing protein [Verrucomicrobiales bacterium]